MDSLVPIKFNEIFRRVAITINLKGAYSPEEIDVRMDEARDRLYHAGQKGKAKQIQKLRRHGFPDRVIDEAVARPRQIVAQTLRHGYSKAKKIVAEYNERRRERRHTRSRRNLP